MAELHNKTYKIARVAIIHESEIPNDVIDDLQGSEIEDDSIKEMLGQDLVYNVKYISKTRKDINGTTYLRKKNLTNQLQDFDYLVIHA